jgi:prophage DNA circulation protein
MVDWRDRLNEVIILTSPLGTDFAASWRGNPRSLTNKVGIHEFPGIQGARVQDLRAGAYLYPLTITFSGQEHDVEAEEFMEALKNESGTWIIEHPTKGPIFAIWMSANEQIQPVTSANITVFELNFIEPLPESEAESLEQQQAKAQFAAGLAFDDASNSFQDVLMDTASQVQSVISSVGAAITTVKKQLRLVENFAILDPQIAAIEAAINNTLSEPIIDTEALAGQIQQYVRIFGLGQTSATDAIEMYSNFANNVLKDVPSQPTKEGLSKMSVTELTANAAVSSAGEMALIGGIETREQLITTVQKLTDMQETVSNSLDTIQEIYADEFIDERYYSQLKTYKTTFMGVAESVRYLLLSIFGLPSERRIVLKKDTFIAQIAHDEYGSIGDETDELANIDKLISSNCFLGNDIYMLEARRQVLIYQ